MIVCRYRVPIKPSTVPNTVSANHSGTFCTRIIKQIAAFCFVSKQPSIDVDTISKPMFLHQEMRVADELQVIEEEVSHRVMVDDDDGVVNSRRIFSDFFTMETKVDEKEAEFKKFFVTFVTQLSLGCGDIERDTNVSCLLYIYIYM